MTRKARPERTSARRRASSGLRARRPRHPRYRIIRKLGSGGHATVWLARDVLAPDSEFALKVAHDEESSARLIDEYRLLRGLRHSAVPQAYDGGRLPDSGDAYMALEHIDAPDLAKHAAELRRHGADGLDELVRVLLEIAVGLDYLHRNDVLHLDLKPQNVVCPQPLVKLLDFGVARPADRGRVEIDAGTAHYAAPEVLASGHGDARSDLYSLGALMYTCITGRRAMRGRSLEEIRQAQLQESPSLPAKTPRGLAPIISTLLEYNPANRYRDVSEVLGALRQIAPDDDEGSRPRALEEPRLAGRRRELGVFCRWLDRLRNGRGPGLLAVEGDAEMGKSGLVGMFQTELGAAGVRHVALSCHTLGQDPAFRTAVRYVLLSLPKQLAQTGRSALLRTFLDLGKTRAAELDLTRMTLGQVHDRVVREAWALTAGAADEPIVLMLEDLHLADALTVEFVRRLATLSIAGLERVGVIASTRDDADALLRTARDDMLVEKIRLGPLSASHRRESLAPLAPRLPRDAIARIASVSKGIPGQLVRHAHRALASSTLELPVADGATSPREYLRDRIAKLSQAERQALLFVALRGQPTPRSTLASLTDDSPAATATVSIDLLRVGLVKETSTGLYPSQDCPVDDIVGDTDERTIRHAHDRIAALHLKAGDAGPRTALHLLRAGKRRRAIELLEQSAPELDLGGNVDLAVRIYDEFLEHGRSGRTRCWLLERAADCLVKRGRLSEATDRYAEILDLPRLNAAIRLRVSRKLGGAFQRSGNSQQARAALEAALVLAEREPRSNEHLLILYELAALELFLGEFACATSHARAGHGILDALTPQALPDSDAAYHRLNFRSILGNVFLRQFDFDAAIAEFEEGLDLAGSTGSMTNEAVLLNNLGLAYRQSNRLGAALRVYRRAAKVASTGGDDTALFSIQCNEAAVLSRLGRLREARKRLVALERQPLTAESVRARLFLAHTKGLVQRIERSDARSTWEQSLRLSDEIGDPQFASYGKVWLLDNEIREGRWSAARRVLKTLETLSSADERLTRSIDVRRAWLDSLTGWSDRAARHLASTGYERLDQVRAGERLSHGDLADGLVAAITLIELGHVIRAEAVLDRLRRAFDRAKELPGSVECRLLLADAALRRGDVDKAEEWLRQATAVGGDDAEVSPNECDPRVPFLEARAALAAPSVDRTRVRRLIDLAVKRQPRGTTHELRWLAALVRAESQARGATGRLSQLAAFLDGLTAPDRKRYEARDHRRRLGLGASLEGHAATGVSAAWRLEALTRIRGADSAYRALEVILDALDAAEGAIFSADGELVASIGLKGARKKSDFAARCLELRTGRVARGLCIEVATADDTLDAVLWAGPPRAGQELESESERLAYLRLVAMALPRDALASPAVTRDATTASLGKTTGLLNPSAADVVSRSPVMQPVLTLIRKARESSLPVLLVGESGVGKDFLARRLHDIGPRRHRPFVTQSCTAVPEGLLEVDLFGHEEGAFTGAHRSKRGFLLEADGGTFYLDNVDSAPLATQAHLLRVLDTGTVRPVGSNQTVNVDIRFIASTHSDLEELAREGRFRTDLLYRLTGLTIEVPPLRRRPEDIPILVEYFRSRMIGGSAEFDEDAMRVLMSHDWPGNIRQLETVVRRLNLTTEGRIGARDVAQNLGGGAADGRFPRWLFRERSYEEALADLRREYLLFLFEECGGDIAQVADRLGTTKRNAYLRFSRSGIDLEALRRAGPDRPAAR